MTDVNPADAYRAGLARVRTEIDAAGLSADVTAALLTLVDGADEASYGYPDRADRAASATSRFTFDVEALGIRVLGTAS